MPRDPPRLSARHDFHEIHIGHPGKSSPFIPDFWLMSRRCGAIRYSSDVATLRRDLIVAIRIVRLGTDRVPGEGLRIGTVRRPPRGILKTEYASKNFYDVWLPALAPSPEAVKQALTATSQLDWNRFVKKYRREMAAPDQRLTLDLLAALSHQADFSVGCYCADESHCHRSVLRQLFLERRAKVK
jgi:uncharacterized protein YeaO (DUF488 family)